MTGFGKAENLPYPYSLYDYANEIKEILNLIGEQRVDVVAHSFGARVLIKLLEMGENRIDKIIFTGAAGLKPRRNAKFLLKRASFLLLKNFVKREKLKSFYSEDYRNLSEVERQSFQKIIGENFDSEIGKIKNKTLIVFGEKDRQTPLYMAKKFKRLIKGSRLEIIGGAGHFCFSDKPQKFNAYAFKFLME